MSERTLTPRAGSSFLANTAVLSGATLFVSAANYALNIALARMLSPTDFGDANLAINLVLASAVVAATLQLVTSKMVAAHPERRDAVRRSLLRVALVAGAVVLVGFGAGAWVWADVLNTSTPWMFVILGLGLPVYFVQAVYRGIAQGDLRFSRLALSYIAEATVRVVGALALVAAGFGVIGASVAIAVSFVASAAVARGRRTAPTDRSDRLSWNSMRSVVVGATILLVAQVVIGNGDLVLSKAFFTPETAGLYASAALVGRAVFFASWSVVNAVFPLAARASLTSAQRRRAVVGALVLVAALGAAAFTVVALWGDAVARVMFGGAYSDAVPLLAPYVLACTLFALANVLAAIDLATGRRAGPLVLAAGAVLQTVLLVVAGHTPEAMVWVQVIAMAGTALTALALWIVVERRLDK